MYYVHTHTCTHSQMGMYKHLQIIRKRTDTHNIHSYIVTFNHLSNIGTCQFQYSSDEEIDISRSVVTTTIMLPQLSQLDSPNKQK